ncbi:M56 family metallopeptidase [Psychroserpens sp. XS_ASV72]|uniref:M56 family metallopeptidase n=1 Tax=Psychroserpens sp. XS_ASV72 TaxID=3241293 RepID=UPI003519A4FA
MEYLLKPSAIIFIFYLSYKLFLQRDTFFESNRWFLLFGLIAASCISWIVIPNYIEYTPIEYTTYSSYGSNTVVTPIQNETLDIQQLLFWIYIAGFSFFMTRLVIQLLSLRHILKKGEIVVKKPIKFIESKEPIAPFSFFNAIVYNPQQFNTSELQHVINHEKAHVKHWHTLDSILAHLACVVLWFNPFIWLYKKALQQNLEFIADRKAQYVSSCERSYQTVLLKTSIQNHNLAFANHFYTSLIKKRIVMLHKSKSNQLNQLKLLIVLPLLAVFIMSFNTEDIYVKVPSNEALVQGNDLKGERIEIIITKSTTDKDLETIKKDLESNGITFTYDNLKRNDQGDITSIDVEFKSEDNAANYNVKDENGIKAFRFESSDNNFSIGVIDQKASTFTFKSSDGKTKSQSSATGKVIVIEEEDDNNSNNEEVEIVTGNNFSWKSNDEQEIVIEASDEPLFIINGKTVSKAKFEDVDSQDIQSVFVLKGENAIKKYGSDGKNGVIIMHKKGGNSFFFNTDDSNDVHVETKTRVNVESDNDPLIIVDGKVIEKKSLKDVSPNIIHEVEVIKDKDAVKVYGKKAKDGVIKITTKKGKTMLNGDAVVFETEEDGPWKIDTAVSSVYFIDDDKNIKSIEFVITKQSSDAFLEEQKKNLKSHGIDAKFSKVRRNKDGEITNIKISLDDNKGRKSSASWKEKNDAIPDIVMGKSNDDKLYIQAIGN